MVKEEVQKTLFQEFITIQPQVVRSAIAANGNARTKLVFNIDASQSRNSIIYLDNGIADLNVISEPNMNGTVVIHYAAEGRGSLNFNMGVNLHHEGFNLSWEKGKSDMLFWTNVKGTIRWRRAKGF